MDTKEQLFKVAMVMFPTIINKTCGTRLIGNHTIEISSPKGVKYKFYYRDNTDFFLEALGYLKVKGDKHERFHD